MLKTKPVGQSSAAATHPTSQVDLVTTATLVRGRIYFYRDLKEPFEIGVPRVVEDEATAAALEELHFETTDGDGERFEKPLFLVQRNVPRPSKAQDNGQQREQVRRLPVRPLPLRR
jgi:hypothetical protein